MYKRHQQKIAKSDLISRDLSWLQFNHRVLEQAEKKHRNLLEKLKFLAITSSNADEFFMIRVGSLYNYVDYSKNREDYSGLDTIPFKNVLLEGLMKFGTQQDALFLNLKKQFKDYGFEITNYKNLIKKHQNQASEYFDDIIFPMLTPMVYDPYHPFPVMNNQVLIFGVLTKTPKSREKRKKSFIQIPTNLPRFFEIYEEDNVIFVPVETIIREHLDKVFRNIEIISSSLFRVTRNGDFTLDEPEDIDDSFLEEMKKKLKTRKSGRVVRMELESGADEILIKQLKKRYEIADENIKKFRKGALIDYTCLWQIVGNKEFASYHPKMPKPVLPISMSLPKGDTEELDMFSVLDNNDVLLHHPYNTIEPLLDLLDQAAEDPDVLSIKLTIYRLAKNSRVIEALLKAVENGKNVAALFEVKARFDEENNMREAKRLQKAGCFVVYGVGMLKTHTKLLLIVRKDGKKVKRYVHMSSGNYNESTSKLYTDIGLLSSDEGYGDDVQEFFNVITGHSMPNDYENLITAPTQMRTKLIKMINQETANKKEGKSCGIAMKMNSLQDKDTILALYEASKAGVPIKLIIRGICCIRPGRKDLSENVEVRSIVGDYLEHSRIFYFHNAGNPKVYSGSADMMVRSFDRRMESLFIVKNELLKQQLINLLAYNLKDNANAYLMNEDGSYTQIKPKKEELLFDVHREFYAITKESVMDAFLF